MAFETTYGAFLARVTEQHGPTEARAICEPHARNLARSVRALAAGAEPASAARLLRLADQMDPDRRDAPDAPA
ncbi:hypothetical protein ACGFXC_09225 [Streptomyces sp. NPDC048507]|uniref:hypothetical protein n=1 Tax=Streptomyces sp. NPDC048507 TaxID=3365560 RepID=UPI00371B5A89